MKKNFRRAMSLILSVVMVASSFNVSGLTSMAEEAETEVIVEQETAAPETSAPETTAPETSAPETAAPETAAPETSAPKTTAPETSAPEVVGPEKAYEETGGSSENVPADTEAPKEKTVEKDEEKQTESESESETEAEVLAYQTLTASIEQNAMYLSMSGSSTRITLEGVMPEGATVKAVPVDVEIEGIAILAAYDITIYDKDGKEYQPQEGAIKVHIENSAIREAEDEENELYVYHMENASAAPERVSILKNENGAVEFNADRFSIYIVGEDKELYDTEGDAHYVYKLSFYIEDDSSQPISTQTVSPGEYVEMPAVPDRQDYEFVGWFSEPNGGGEQYLDYTNVMPEIEGDADVEINLYAHYIEIHYVHYMTQAHEEGDENTRVIFHSEAYTPDQTLDTSTAESLYLSEGYLSYVDEATGQIITELAVTGWQDADGQRWQTGDSIDWDSIDGDLILYPIVEGAYWVYYDMNGHDSIENPEPEYVLASETYIGTLPEPEVSGYTFDGWYTAAEGGTRVTSTTTLESLPKNSDGSITLYAHWTETYVAYTINIWRQKATDGKAGLTNKEIASGETYDDYIGYYDYAESHYVSADQSRLKTGETPTTSIVDSWSTYTGYATTSSRDSDSAYYGFEYSNTTAQTRTVNELATKTMAADGSTIINIYYNRVTITWNFGTSANSTRTGTLIGLYDTNVSLADDVEPGGTLSSWPANSNNYLWSATTSSTNTTFKARFDLDNGTTVNWRESSSSRSHYLYFYLEVTNEDTQVDENGSKAKEASDYGVAYTRTVNSKLYVYNQRTGISSSSFNFTDKYAGYHLVGYIDRSNGSTQTTYTDASAGGSHTFSNNGYIFNDANTDLTITLISSDKVVGVDSAGNAIETAQEVTYPDASHTVKYGASMSNYPFPETLDGEIWGPAYYYHFVGWYEDPTFTAPFSITTMPNNNVVAYADWELNDITVTFNTGTSDVEAPAAQELQATQKATDPGTLEREGYTHVGWVDQNGKVFNFDTVLYADTTLTAIWKADDESGYTMQYDLNVDNSYGLFDGYTGDTASANGDHFTVDEELWTLEKAFPDLQGTDYEDAYSMFIGWNTAADGSGTMYYPDDDFTLEDVAIDNEGRVTLYAIWAHKNESTLILEYNYPEGYEPDGGKTEIILTGDNLTAIDLEGTSGLGYHDEITVTIDGVTHTYRFDGWSTTTVGSNATDDDVDIAADATVAVDTLETSTETNANYLFAVWLEVHNITVTKEVVNDAVNYTVPDDQTFSFNWSFVDGEGVTNSNEETITIGDKGTFTIPDVASGESVTITETQATGFTTTYNGAHTDVADDGNGTYTFTMDDNSQEITVYNTVETNKLTVNKVWKDANGDEETGVEHDAVTVTVNEDGTSLGELTLSAENNWADSLEVVVKSDATYTVSEDSVDGYTTTVSEMTTDETTGDVGFTVTNTEIPYIDIEVTKEWIDDGNRDGLESGSITVQLEIDQEATEPEQTLTLSESNNWTDSFIGLPKYDENGNEINYSVEETEVPTGYTATYTKTDDGWKITNTHEDYLVSEITITKTWDDADDQDGKRPESVKFELQVNNSTVTDQNGESWIVELTENDADANDPDTWTTTITDHPIYVYEEGTQISYTLHEDDVAEGYTTSDGTVTITPVYDEGEENIVSYTGAVTVTNTHTPEVYGEDGTLTVIKTWDDANNQDGFRPQSVSVTLSAVDSEGKEVTLPESVEATKTITVNDNWETTYEGLYKYSDGKEITYTVSETAVDGYTTTYAPASDDDEATGSGAITSGEVMITNTHTPETVDVEGSKTWDDNDNQDGKRPDSITIRLMANGNPVDEKTVTAADDWKWSFTGLDKNSNGTEIVYTITENAVSDYTTTYEEGTYNVTNSYVPETTTVTITKEWDDDSNRDGKRPENVTVTLTGTNGSSQDLTLNEGNNWTTTVNVPMYYNNGQLVVYSVSESTVAGYDEPVITSTGGYNFVVTNTHTPELVNETGDITVTKTWNDNNNQDGKRDSYAVTLTGTIMVDGETQTVSTDTETLSEDQTSYTWKNMPKYSAGEEISYSVTETAVPDGYTATYGGDLATGFTVTNTHTPEVYEEVTVNKAWVDDDNRDGMETAIEVQLYANGSASGDPVSLTGEEDNWTYTWVENLPKYEDGEEITYSVQETGVPEGYTVTYSGDVESGFVITNTHESKTVSNLTITKVWDDKDDQDGIRPESVIVELQINGSTATDVDGNSWTATLTKDDVDADGNWTITVDDHPVYVDENGAEISYTLHEDTVTEGYEATDGTVTITEEDGKYTGEVTITNTHTPETIDVEGSKTWDYGTDPDTKPASIMIRLLADGTELDSATVTADNNGDWAWSFTDLPKYRDGGIEIVYTITEDAVENYTTTYGEGTYDVTNTYNPDITTVTITKEWDDDSDRDGKRPEDVTVTLTGSNKFSEDVTLNGANSWTDTVDVPMYDNNGELVTYDVSEDRVDGYDEPVITSTGGYNFTVTNTHEPEVYGKDGTLTVNKVWVDDENRDGLETDIVVQLEIDQVATGQTVTLSEDNEWTDTFTGLLKYEDGEEINYSVEEAAVPDGYTVAYTQNGDDWTITNTHDDYLVSRLTITKIWDDADNQDGIRPESVDVELQIDGSTAKDADGNKWTATLTNKQVDEDGNWTVTVTDHPVYLDEEGQQITYTLHEDNVPEGYEAADGTVEITEDDEGNYIGAVTITNTHTPETVDVEGSKTWDDGDDEDEDRPEDITIRLYADGSEIDSQTVTADGDGNWAWSFTDLPKYRDGGVEIAYTITEDAVYHYSTTYDAYDVTNTHTSGKTSVTVMKVWDDVNDHDSVRPDSVTIDLLADGEQIDKMELTGEGNVWTESFTGLDKYDGTTEIAYSIVEEGVENGQIADGKYNTSDIDGDASTAFIITNTHDVTDWSVKKTLTNSGSGANGAFKLGETAQFTITVTNTGNTEIKGIEVTEALDGATFTEGAGYTLNEEKTVATIEGLAEGDSIDLYAEYTIEEKDLGTELQNSVTTSDGNPEDPEPGDKTPFPTEDPDPHMTVTKTTTSTPENGETYVLGEEVTYEITVENDGNRTLEDITVTDELTGDEWTIDSLAPGASETFEAAHEVTEEDILNGSVVNEATASANDPDNPRQPVPDEPGIDEEPTEEKDGHLTVTKEVTSEPANGEAYTYGEEIQYTITVTNDGNLTITDITVTDELTGLEKTIDSLAPGASEEFTTSHKVTMDDVNAGSVTNEATVEGTSPDPDEPDVPSEPGEVVTPTEAIDYFPMDEEIVPGKDDEANPGSWVDRESVNEYESIEIEMSTTLPNVSGEVLAAGNFNMTFHNILDTQLVLDELDSDFTVDINGDSIGHQYYEIDMIQTTGLIRFFSISDGCTFHVNVDLSALYNDGVISEEDLGTGTVRVFFYADLEATDVNGSYKSTAWYDLADGDEVLYTSDQSVVAVYTFENIVDKYDSKTNKALPNATFGIYYDEACENPVSRNEASYVVTTDAAGQAMFVGIAEGTYYLKELEAPEGYVLDETPISITLTGSEDGEHILEISVGNTPAETSATETTPEPAAGSPTVIKKATSSPANGSAYVEGEKVTYEITVKNDTEEAIGDIKVTDALTGDEWAIDILAPGEEEIFKTSYTVTADDVASGSVVNVATAAGVADDGTPVESSGTESVPTGTDEPAATAAGPTVTKKAVSEPENGKTYQEGETIRYEITVANNTNVSIGDIEVKDDLTGDVWTIDVLAVGEAETFEAEYTVTRDDLSEGKVVNVATASGVNSNGNAVTGSGSAEVEVGAGTTETVKTGDETPIALMISLMIMSMAFFVNVFIDRKRRIYR